MALPREAPRAPTLDTDYYSAVCVGATCLGTVQQEYAKQTRTQLKVSWTFELKDQGYALNDGEPEKPRLLSITLNHSVSKPSDKMQAKIWELRETWIDKPMSLEERRAFNSNSVVGEYAKILIKKEFKDGEARNSIDGISPYKGQSWEPMTKPWSFDVTSATDVAEVEAAIEGFPEWQQDAIRSSAEYMALIAQ